MCLNDFLKILGETDDFYDFKKELDMGKLFRFIDFDNSGKIGKNEFKYYFYEREFLEMEVKNGNDWVVEKDLKTLFSRIDSDGSGYIDT